MTRIDPAIFETPRGTPFRLDKGTLHKCGPRPPMEKATVTRTRTIRLCTLDRLLGVCIVVFLGVIGWALLELVSNGREVATLRAQRAEDSRRLDILEQRDRANSADMPTHRNYPP